MRRPELAKVAQKSLASVVGILLSRWSFKFGLNAAFD